MEPGNKALTDRAAEVEKLRRDGRATLPTTIALEKTTNPFLRADETAIRTALGLAKTPAVEVFAELRRRKDNFR